ncbi:MAG: N-acetylmuramic acid 6-phosphate etherase [Erysipelotrichaceae bacterium]
MLNLKKLTTESRNPNTMDLDTKSSLEIVTIMNQEDNNVIKAVNEVLPEIATAVDWCAEALANGGRMIYMGAGTSGRLAVQDSVECPPTFGVDKDVVTALLAGGAGATKVAQEGAEDHAEYGIADLKYINCTSKDIVIGIAASGRTPYVIGGFEYAKELGCKTVSIACNKNAAMSKYADLAIEPDNGPEILTGSSRLKSGTSQKMILNMLSTGAMIKMGKVYQNLMVDVKQTNEKLVDRAQRIIMEATGCTREEAVAMNEAAHGKVKVAIIMIMLSCDEQTALAKLEETKGHIRAAIQ